MLVLGGLAHLVAFYGGSTESNFINHLFIFVVAFHYFVIIGIVRAERVSRWTALALVTNYTLSLGTPVQHGVLSVANFLFLEHFWSTAWTRTSQT